MTAVTGVSAMLRFLLLRGRCVDLSTLPPQQPRDRPPLRRSQPGSRSPAAPPFGIRMDMRGPSTVSGLAAGRAPHPRVPHQCTGNSCTTLRFIAFFPFCFFSFIFFLVFPVSPSDVRFPCITITANLPTRDPFEAASFRGLSHALRARLSSGSTSLTSRSPRLFPLYILAL